VAFLRVFITPYAEVPSGGYNPALEPMDAVSAPAEPFDLEQWLEAQSGPPAIVQAGAFVLRRETARVPRSLVGSRALARLVEIMVETMRAAPGVGLAAPQIGVPLRVFVAEDSEATMSRLSSEAREARKRALLPLAVVVNPELTASSPDEAIFYEGCLSVRGYGALVRRWTEVNVVGTDARGARVALRLSGWPARIAQHETDHLDGTLYVDRMISRSLACDAELARLSAMPVGDVLREIGPASD
jgi:peptide deformylase